MATDTPSTTGRERAKTFYGELLGWSNAAGPPGECSDANSEHGGYTLFSHDDEQVAGMYALPQEQAERGAPPHWISHVAVADADATSAKIKACGGTVVMGPMDIMDLGRMSMCIDPTGAAFCIWQAKEHGGGRYEGQPGSACWFELMTRDTAAAAAFYGAVFGWSAEEKDTGPMPYTILLNGAQPAGGMMQITPEMGEVPSHWGIYFAVEDCDADVARVKNLGGRVCMPPMDIPEAGRFAALLDPAGVAFGIIRLVEGPGC